MVFRTTLRPRAQLTLPAEVRTALKVEDGDELEFDVSTDGVVTVRGMRLVPTDQAWFWTQSWQQGERQASEDLAKGDTSHYDSTEVFLKSLR